ncbi:MAG TPA: hypothetical protein VJU18_03250 [Vicinamibacteria bacterium]|nr:hypothetical protein [Vicinamibacteria bacterium]
MTTLPAANGMEPPDVRCPHCAYLIERNELVRGPNRCDRCQRDFEAFALEPPVRGFRATSLGEDPGATACSLHSGNRATGHCARCGVFFCPVCRLEADRKGYCPACFERLLGDEALSTARRHYTDYGSLGALFAVLGLCAWIFALALGPAAVYYSLKGLTQRDALGETGTRLALWGWLFLGVFDFLAGAGFLIALFR